ncbi:MAG: MarR family transcriptional regulator [Candidatus Hodarchaeales archaeon]
MAYLYPNSDKFGKIKLSNSAIATLDLLHSEQQLTVKAITDELPYSQRTIQYALHQLRSHSLVERRNTLHDLRESIYLLSAKASLYGYNPKSM